MRVSQSKLIASLLGADESLITPDDGPPAGAPRPRDCTMDTTRLEALGIGQRTPVASALATVLREAGVLALPAAEEDASKDAGADGK